MRDSALPATGLVQTGSLLTYDWRVLLPAGTDPQAVAAAIRAAFPGSGWRIRDTAQAAPGVSRAVDQTSLFLTLVGLCSLLVGGIGVATGVRAWMEARARTVATLRCLGAPGRADPADVPGAGRAAVPGGDRDRRGGRGGAAGLGLAAVRRPAAGARLGRGLSRAARAGRAVWRADGGGVRAVAAGPGGADPRGGAVPRRAAAVRARGAGAGVGRQCRCWSRLLVAIVVGTAANRCFALWFCGSAAATLLLFRAGGAVLMAAARRVRVRRPVAVRLGVANLHRPASQAPLLLVALGLGLTTLSAVALIQGNIRRQILGELPEAAPSFFFIDIQNEQLARFERIVHDQPGTTDLHQVPSMRARIVALKGVPVDQVHVKPGSEWGLRGDRGLTYSAEVPRGSIGGGRAVVAGGLRRAAAGLAGCRAGRRLGPRVGDTIRVNVLGRDLDLKIANLRAIQWRQLAINFALVASPGLLEHAPHMHIATVREPAAEDAPLLRAVTDALPNVTGIRVADILQSVADLVGKLATALAATGSVTLASGALVLAGAVAAGQRRRVAEAVVLKTLGATRAQIRTAWLVEFGAIGATAGLIAAGAGHAGELGRGAFPVAGAVVLPARHPGADGRRLHRADARLRLCRHRRGVAGPPGASPAQ